MSQQQTGTSAANAASAAVMSALDASGGGGAGGSGSSGSVGNVVTSLNAPGSTSTMHHHQQSTHGGYSSGAGANTAGGVGAASAGNPPGGSATPLSRQQIEQLSSSESLLELHTKVIPSRLSRIWIEQKEEVEGIVPSQKYNFKHHNDLPLARIKRIMKSDESVRMISAEAPILLAKATELFLLDLTIRANCYSEHFRRGSIEKEDVVEVIRNTPTLDFLAAIMDIPQGPGVQHFISGQAKMQ